MGFPWAIAAASGSTALNVWGQRQANETNIKLGREQRAFEERMSNTAIQRRADDIEKAGGNRALAFVNGSEATTPSMSAPTVQAEDYGDAGAKIMMALNAANVKADTAQKLASARIQNVEANVREAGSHAETEARTNKWVEQFDQDDLRTKILRSQDTSSAAEAKRLSGQVDSLIQKAKQEAEAGKLDLEAMRRFATMYGLDAKNAGPIIRMIFDAIRAVRKPQ